MELVAILAVLIDSAQLKLTQQSAPLCLTGLPLPTDENEQPFNQSLNQLKRLD